MCPVTVGDALHTGKMVRGKNGLVDDEFTKVRHMDADMIDQFLSHLVSELSAERFLCFAGKVKAVGAGNVVSGRSQ